MSGDKWTDKGGFKHDPNATKTKMVNTNDRKGSAVDDSRFHAPPRRVPECTVSCCDREAVCENKGWRSPFGDVQMPDMRLCAEHEARFFLVQLLFLGDAHAVAKWQAYCDALAEEFGRGAQEDGRPYGVLGVGPGTLPATVVSRTHEWRCAACGGGMSGGYSRGYWTHTCGGDNPVAAKKEQEASDV